ncbi:hypothetical protein ACIBL8_15420 [Streptomyces sp. NPDC050523]|uniref:hypothetical protein n=1 Tax=Streptomyces sp. NPDC050523 TaxID=3365622 RepID=UPI00379EE171
MPATLVAPHLPPTVLVEELEAMERAVALYASDMPTRYRLRGPEDTAVIGWITQGVARLGREEIRQRASRLLGHRKLWLRDMTTPEIDRRHKERFPSKRRLNIAESMASTTVMWVGIVPAARNLLAEIDGPCPRCDDAGKLWVNQVIDDASGWYEEGYVPCWVCQNGGAE